MAGKALDDLPYRPGVGMCVFNAGGRVFVGRRSGDSPEHVGDGYEWQMPQGGIDEGEDPGRAALRELYEETNISSVRLIGCIEGWLRYDLPPEVARRAWKGRYRGQQQKWFALSFTGDDREIDIAAPGGGGHKPEFRDWKWVPIEDTVALIIPFKREVYKRVVAGFAPFVAAR